MNRLVRKARWGWLLVVGSLLTASCASVRFMEDLNDYADTVEDLQQQAAQDLRDPEPLRDLGIIYLRTNNFARANEYLQLAFARDTDDAKTLFHLGLANEALGKPETALPLYQRYREFSLLNPYRRLMAGRLASVRRKNVQDVLRARLADEARLVGEQVQPNVIAVYPLVYQGMDEQYAPLGRGLAELITVDLSQVEALQVVERIRVQALIDEINLAQSAHFDPSTAPRVGRLVGAGRLVGGVYDISGVNDVQLDAAMWEAEQAAVADLGTRAGALRNLFQLEKEVVFGTVDALGITLTQAERQRIEFIPTENLQAFLAFSRGLEREDAGAFDEAARFYEQAVQLDPNFRAARDRVDEVLGLTHVAGSFELALVAAFQQDPFPPLPTSVGIDPLGSRLTHLNTNIGTSLVPGVDAREPAAESGSIGLQDPLRDPPPPPQTDGGG